MKILCAVLADLYFDTSLRSIEYNTFWPACQELGEARLFPFWRERRNTSKREMNIKFVETVIKFKPDVIFTVPFQDDWMPEVMESVSCPTIAWFCDSYRGDYLRSEIPRYSHIVVTDDRGVGIVGKFNKPVKKMIWACNPALHKPNGTERDLGVVWVGQKHGRRGQIIDTLKIGLGSNLSAFGHGFTKPVTTAEYIRLLNRAKIGLSLCHDATGIPHPKARPFEVAGCEAMLLSEKPSFLEGYLEEGQEYIGFRNLDEAIALAHYYLNNPGEREVVALAGHRRTHREHTYKHRLGEVFEWAIKSA